MTGRQCDADTAPHTFSRSDGRTWPIFTDHLLHGLGFANHLAAPDVKNESAGHLDRLMPDQQAENHVTPPFQGPFRSLARISLLDETDDANLMNDKGHYRRKSKPMESMREVGAAK